MATGSIKIPSSGDTTPEYNAVRKSYGEINSAIIPKDFISQAYSCELIPSPDDDPSNPPLKAVLNEISRDPVNYYSLQHIVGTTLNVGNRFDKGISKMETTFQLEMRKYIPASSPEDPEVEPDNGPKVFISVSQRKVYSDSPDAYAEAKGLYDELEAQGCKPWMDEKGLEFGDVLAKEIFQAIKQCDFIIPIMTGGYATSLWCLRELYYAALQKDPKPKTIIPMLLEDEDVIDDQKAGKWLLRIGTEQKYFRPKKEEKDAVIKSLKDKIVKTQEKLPHPSTGAHTNVSVECSRFISSMKGKYEERRINREKQWPPCHSDKLVRLELVEREKGEGYSANTRRGRENEGIKRTPLAYGDLFKVESGKRRVRKVLVEGDAGIGKTTLCIAVSEDWANGKLFQQFELVLLLPLRMKAVASAGSLPELLNLLHPSPRLCDSVARYLEDEEGESVLIIADGWDELGESQRQEGSFLYQFLFGHCLISVVVTSRPSASARLRKLPDIDRFVEVRGFSKEHIVEYIQSEFTSDQGKADRLREQLEGNPLIESVCSVPLNCAIVCHLWRTLEEALPTTMTELYTKIILNLILRNICKLDAYESVLKLPKFESLPADLQQSWWLLCEFAFRALEKDQLVFSQEELEVFFPKGLALDKGILCFGLLQSAESVGVGISFHFLHLTFQEFLAAQYLARQRADKQLEAFQTYKFFSSNRFKMVWKFLFGINSNLEFNEDIISFIQQTLKCVAGGPDDEDTHVLSYYTLSDRISVCHCAFESHNDLVNKNVTQYLVTHPIFNDMIDFGYPGTAHDCSAMLYVITNLQECGHGLNINFGNASDNQIKELLHILASKIGKLWISDLDLSGNRLTVSSLQALESAVRGDVLAKLEDLSLEGSLTGDADTNAKWLATLSGHCPNLKSLHLSNNNLGVPGASALAKLHVSDRLRLNKINLGDIGLNILVKSIKVIFLELADNDIHASSVSCLADAVCSGEFKIDGILNLSGNPLGLEGTKALGRMLSSIHCKLHTIHLSRCDLTTVGGDLPSTDSLSCEAMGRQLCQMPQTSTIFSLDLNHNSFTGDGIHILAGFMHLCPDLQHLYTHHCGITSDDLIWLLGRLKSSSPGLCSELKGWHLQDNQIDGRGVSALMDHLPSLFPHLWCDKFRSEFILPFFNNPVIHNKEMMERLKEELTRHQKRYEEEQTRLCQAREEEEELTRHLQEIKRVEEELMRRWRKEKQTRQHREREKRLREELMNFFREREGTDRTSSREREGMDKISSREGDVGTDVVLNWQDVKIEKGHEEEEHEELQ